MMMISFEAVSDDPRVLTQPLKQTDFFFLQTLLILLPQSCRLCD